MLAVKFSYIMCLAKFILTWGEVEGLNSLHKIAIDYGKEMPIKAIVETGFHVTLSHSAY